MSGSTISGTITSTVTLGNAFYPSPLTVTGTGLVAPTAFSAIGIYAPAGSGTLINDGSVIGGTGTTSSSGAAAGIGGSGVALLGGSTATNAGTITGGVGGEGFNQSGAAGGYGVSLAAGAVLTNLALINGGVGGTFTEQRPLWEDGAGGAGVDVDGGTLTNRGTIAGGYSFGGPELGGSGVVLQAGTLINTGTIAGGTSAVIDNGGGGPDAGVDLAAGATLINAGTISGGYNPEQGGDGIFIANGASLTIGGVVIGGFGGLIGGLGIDFASVGSLDNVGTIVGGAGGGGVGVLLGNGDTVTNAATIVGGAGVPSKYSPDGNAGGAGAWLVHGGVLINTAFIAGGTGLDTEVGGQVGAGVYVEGGTLTNSANATITGAAAAGGNEGSGGAGVYLAGGTVLNAGLIAGGDGEGTSAAPDLGGEGGTGVSLNAGATLINTGSIGGGVAGYYPSGGRGGDGVALGTATAGSFLLNAGLITGGDGNTVAAGGTLGANQPYDAITGGVGVSVAADDTLINTGTIAGGAGVYVGAGGLFADMGTVSGGNGVSVASGGTALNSGTVISGVGVYLAAGATLIAGGTIGGGMYGGVTADAVLFAAGGTLVVDPGASFAGQVVANAASTGNLVLADYGAINGTLSGIGTQFVNFDQITVGADAAWTLTGANTIATGTTLTELSGASLTDTGTLVNDGTIVLDPSTMTVAALTGVGSVAIEAGSTLGVEGTITSGETLVFGGSGAYLHLGSPDEVAGSITNFGVGDTVDLAGVDPSTVEYASGQLTFGGGGDIPLAVVSDGTVVAAPSSDGAAVTVVLCFCANTQILTPSGERPVQELAAGDLVLTRSGEARPIVWAGVGKVLATRGQRGAATPVIVRKGALGDNIPNRDLRVTKGHALWFDGVLIPVEFLVNHRLIEWDDRAQEVDVYHLELPSHDVLIANGAPAESYRDDGNRWLFRNANAGWDLPPQTPCAPVLTGGPLVDAVWLRLLERAGPRPGFVLTDDPDLHLLVDGRRVDARETHGTAYVFDLPARSSVSDLPAGPAAVRIASRAGVPAELGVARDQRLLGVALRRMALSQGTRFRIIEAADPALTEGFHLFESTDGLRWTDGNAALPAALSAGFDGPAELVLHVAGTTRYPLLEVAEQLACAAV